MARRWMNYSFIECKTWGHSWESFDSADTPRGPFRYRETLRCIRCQTQRIYYLDAELNIVSKRYIYADGYRDARGADKPTRNEMRVLIIKRK